MTDTRKPQELFGDETLEQALRQLTLYDHDGLPVVSHDRQHLRGWITRQDVLQTLATSVSSSAAEIEHGAVAADFAARDPEALAHTPSTPLSGYEIVEITITPESPALGRPAGNIAWPPGSLIVAISEGHEIVPGSRRHRTPRRGTNHPPRTSRRPPQPRLSSYPPVAFDHCQGYIRGCTSRSTNAPSSAVAVAAQQ